MNENMNVTDIKMEPRDDFVQEGAAHDRAWTEMAGNQRSVAVVSPQAELSSSNDEQEMDQNEEYPEEQPNFNHNYDITRLPHPEMPGSFQSFYPFPTEKGRMYFRSWRNLTQQRRLFSTEQLVGLKAAFEENAYPSRNQFEQIAKDLKMKEKSVRLWFQNRRARLRKSGDPKSDFIKTSKLAQLAKQQPATQIQFPVAGMNPRLPTEHFNKQNSPGIQYEAPELGEITPSVRRSLLQMQQLAATKQFQEANSNKAPGSKQDILTVNTEHLAPEAYKRRESYRKRMQSNPYFKYYSNLAGLQAENGKENKTISLEAKQTSPIPRCGYVTEDDQPYRKRMQSNPCFKYNSNLAGLSVENSKENEVIYPEVQQTSPISRCGYVAEDEQPLDLSMKKNSGTKEDVAKVKETPPQNSNSQHKILNILTNEQMKFQMMMPFQNPWMFGFAGQPFSGHGVSMIPNIYKSEIGNVK